MQTNHAQVSDKQQAAIYIFWGVVAFTVLNLLLSETWTEFFRAEAGMVWIGMIIAGIRWVAQRI